MTVADDLDRALETFSAGKPDAPQNARTIRMTGVLDTVMALLGAAYSYGNVWDEWPQRCHVVFNVGYHTADSHTYWLMSVSHRDLHYLTDAALITRLQQSIARHARDENNGPVMKAEDNGCL